MEIRATGLIAAVAAVATLATLCFTAPVIAASIPTAADWEKTVAAAKKEGQVVIMGPAGADVRDALTQGFQKKYPGIQVDYNGMAGAQVAPKLLSELSAGVYRTDLVIAGTITAIESLIPAKALVPIKMEREQIRLLG
jgi:iron(III) transport system substrate-binding protein